MSEPLDRQEILDQALIAAVSKGTRKGRQEAVAAYERGARLSAKDADGAPALTLCARNDMPNTARDLIERARTIGDTAGLDAVDAQGVGALISMVELGWPNTLRALLAAGASVSRKDAAGTPSIMLAIQRGHTECAKMMTEAAQGRGDASSLDMSDARGERALIAALKGGCTQTVRRLAQAGASLECADADGVPLISLAIDLDASETAKFLIDLAKERGDAKAIDGFDRSGRGSLARAQARGWESTSKKLVQAGARLAAPEPMEEAKAIEEPVAAEPDNRSLDEMARKIASRRETLVAELGSKPPIRREP